MIFAIVVFFGRSSAVSNFHNKMYVFRISMVSKNSPGPTYGPTNTYQSEQSSWAEYPNFKTYSSDSQESWGKFSFRSLLAETSTVFLVVTIAPCEGIML